MSRKRTQASPIGKAEIDMAYKLFDINNEIKRLEQKSREIKDHFIKLSCDIGTSRFEFDEIGILVVEGAHTNIDRKAMEEDLGKELVSKYTKQTNYYAVRCSDLSHKKDKKIV